MQQAQRTALIQEQRLKLSPQLLQSIRLLAMPAVELRERVLEELERNPALEALELGEKLQPEELSAASILPKERDEGDSFTENSDAPVFSVASNAADLHQAFIESMPRPPETLQDYMLGQLRVQKLSQNVLSLAELIISDLNADGFFEEPPETLPGAAQHKDLLEQALYIVRRLDPPGTAFYNYRESLVFQAELYPDAPALALDILKNHFEVLQKGRPDALIKALSRKGVKISMPEAETAVTFIRSLDPFPGRKYDFTVPQFIVPDVTVKRSGSELLIVLNDEIIPALSINPLFSKLEKDNSENKTTNQFVRESVRDARWFIQSVNQRSNTLLKATRAITEFQRDFFLKGPCFLRPLTQKKVAENIGVHEATVSRISSGRYLQCEWGLFELKYFYSNAVNSAADNSSAFSKTEKNYSKSGVKEIIKKIIAESDKKLSDQKISDILNAQGIAVARRTVAKYRGELAIGSSQEREIM